ncbi:MAG: hypothetical protein JO166_07095 [Deltaproteobacteria bacterium]|nr:hypothetical protein [Deltaproteobacteria bacterium]
MNRNAGWDKVTKRGDRMLSLSVKPRAPRPAAPVDDTDLDILDATPARRP